MGHRLEIYTDKLTAEDIISISKKYGIDAKIIGRVEESQETSLEINTQNGSFTYTK